MYKPIIGTCGNPECGRKDWIPTKRGLCRRCLLNYKNDRKNQKGTDTGVVEGAEGDICTSPKVPKSGRSYMGTFPGLSSRRKPTGELKLFQWIYQNRAHRSEVSGEPITFDVRCFSHILGKQAFGQFRLSSDNIVLKTPQEHDDWHNRRHKLKDDPRWDFVFEKEERLKQKYYNKAMSDYSILNVSLMNKAYPEMDGWQAGIRKVFKNVMDITPRAGFEASLLQAVEAFKPDIIFMQIQHPGIISTHTAAKIAQNSFVINWSGDIRVVTEPWYIDIGRHIQLTCFSNMRDVNNLRMLGINSDYLEIGIDPEIYKPLYEPRHGIVAMFNHYHNQYPLSAYRHQVVHALKEEFKDQFKVYGNNWGSVASGNLNHSQRLENEIYNQALIGINISHFSEPRYSSDRLLRCAASGTMVLSHQFPEMSPWEPGLNCDVFHDTSSLLSKCSYYLNHREESYQIAERGADLARTYFTFEAMAKNILELYTKNKK